MVIIRLRRIFFLAVSATILITAAFIALPPAQVGAGANQPESPQAVRLWYPLVLTSYLYLPVIYKPPPSFINGDFEQGRNVGWTEKSKAGYQLVVNVKDFPASIRPHNGDWAAWLGGANNERSELSQVVNINNGAGLSLSYYYLVDSGESACDNDYGYLEINGSQVLDTLIYLCNNNEQGWQHKLVPLSASYLGNVNFKFVAETNDNTKRSSYFIDDVSLIGQ